MVNDNVHYTLVEKLNGSHASSNAIKTSGSVLTLAEGQIAIVNEAGDCTSTIELDKVYKIARMISGKLEYTPELYKDNILSAKTKAYAAAANKAQILGYNGVSGAFDVADSTVYTVNMLIKDTLTTFGNKEMYKFGTYKTGVSATGLDACIGLVGNLIKNFSREPEQIVEFGVLSGHAGAAMSNSTAITNGSELITFTATEVEAGDFIRTGTGVTDNVYLVKELLTTTTALVDRPITEATNAALDCEIVAASDTAGITFDGVDKSRFQAGLWKFEATDFDVMPIADVAGITNVTAATKGTGTWQTVAEEEWFAQGNRGYGNRVDPMIPYSGPKMGVIEDEQYASYTLKFKDQRFTNLVGQSPASIISVTVYGSTATVAALLADLV